MPTLPTEISQQYSPEESASALGSIIQSISDSGVENSFFELDSDGQQAAVFATTDPAVIQVLRGVFEECGDLSSFFREQ